jgi:hypothetical protein
MKRTAESTIEGLQAALAAEHAAIYGYGVMGARLHGAQQQAVRSMWATHRTRRDQLIGFISALGTKPVAAAAAYKLPVQVTSAQTAAQLGTVIEDGMIAAYLVLAGADDPKLRRFAALAMQEATTRGVRWRGSALATAFPGLVTTAVEPLPEQ